MAAEKKIGKLNIPMSNAPPSAPEAIPHEPQVELAPATPAAALPPAIAPPPPVVQQQIPPQILAALAQAQMPMASERIYVSFSAEINPNTTEALIALLSNHVNRGVKEVYLMLSTPGGSVMNGLNLYNILRALPIKLITHNVGNVDSIGNAIFLAGAERCACPHSTFMFHGVGFDIQGAARFEEKILRERLGAILADQKRIGSIMEERTNLKGGQIRGLFKEARTKDADYARSVGIVHQICDVTIAPGTPVFSLVFQR
jgi:ATP-dependent Clp protease protease subunit